MLTYFLLALTILGQQIEPPNVPATQRASDYPVQVRIIETHWNKIPGAYGGYGRADIVGADVRGLDFTFECPEPFMWNTLHGEYYQARWKKQDLQLELLVQRVGSDHLGRCTLKTTLKAAAYSKTSAGWLKPVPAPPAPAAGAPAPGTPAAPAAKAPATPPPARP